MTSHHPENLISNLRENISFRALTSDPRHVCNSNLVIRNHLYALFSKLKTKKETYNLKISGKKSKIQNKINVLVVNTNDNCRRDELSKRIIQEK